MCTYLHNIYINTVCLTFPMLPPTFSNQATVCLFHGVHILPTKTTLYHFLSSSKKEPNQTTLAPTCRTSITQTGFSKPVRTQWAPLVKRTLK